MKIPKTCKLEKVASKDESREAINLILIDPKDYKGALNQHGNKQAHAIATNGRMLAIVPVDTTPEDNLDGEKLIAPKALTEARKQAKRANESTIGLNGAAKMPNGEVYPIRTDLTFPNWRAVMPEARKYGPTPEYMTVRIDAKALFELSQAIGAVSNQVTLQIPTNDPASPVIIEEKTTGGKGVLMPCRQY